MLTRYTCNSCLLAICGFGCTYYSNKTTYWSVEDSIARSPLMGGRQGITLVSYKTSDTPDSGWKWSWKPDRGHLRMPGFDKVLPANVFSAGLEPWLDQNFLRLPTLNISALNVSSWPSGLPAQLGLACLPTWMSPSLHAYLHPSHSIARAN